MFDQKLLFVEDVTYIQKMVSKKLFLFRKNLTCLYDECLKMTYYGLIHPNILLYVYSSQADLLLKLQSRAIVLMASLGYRQYYRNEFKWLNITILFSC